MKIIILIAACAFSLSAVAQETKKDKWEKMKQYMPTMTKSVGISFQKFDGLNNRIAGFPQYDPVKNHIWTISAGSMHNIKNFITHSTFTAGSSLSGNPDRQSSTVRVLGAGLDFGYDVIPAETFMVYPLVGVGAETYHAIFFKDVSGVDFDDVANSPAMQNSIRKTKFTNTFITYRLGLGVALKSPKGMGTIGLQGGYAGSFADKHWRSAEYQSLNGSPKDGLQRYSVSLILSGGMGNMMHKK